MMEIAAALKTGGIALTAVASVVGGTLYIEDAHDALNAAHVPLQNYESHLSEARVRTIFGYLEQISHSGPQDWLCNALREEIANLCTETPNHSLCADRQDIWESTEC